MEPERHHGGAVAIKDQKKRAALRTRPKRENQNVNLAYNQSTSICKPSITEVIGKYVELRRAGKEQTGLCPFHAEKNPSFSVNEDKAVFHCFGCGVGGDVIDFIKLIEKVSFKEACSRLSMQTYKPQPRPYRTEAGKIVAWARDTSSEVRAALRHLSDGIYICSLVRKEPSSDQKLIAEHEAALVRQWAILCDLDDDLNDPKFILELWAQRRAVEQLVEAAT